MPKKINQEQPTTKPYTSTIWLVFIFSILGITLILQTYYNFVQRNLCKGAIAISPAINQLQAKVTAQQLILENLQAKLQDLSKDKQKSANYWLLVKINYLIQTAKFYLIIERNLPEAIKFLTAAEQSTSPIEDPLFTPIKSALLHDLKTIQNYPAINIPEVATQIEALNQQINNLYTLAQNPSSLLPMNNVNEKPTRLWQRILLVFRRAFIIHRQIPPESLLLLPEQNYSLILQMQAKLQLAEWGWLHLNNNFYQRNLRQLANVLQNYLPHFAPKDAANILRAVKDLQKNNIPEITPNILDASEQAIQTALKQQ